jgi:hypothetical protein
VNGRVTGLLEIAEFLAQVASMEPTVQRSGDWEHGPDRGAFGVASMEPTVQRSGDGSLDAGRLSCGDAVLCERFGSRC